MNDLITLICGPLDGELPHTGSEIDEILRHLHQSLSDITTELNSLKSEADKKVTLLAPFLGRSLLEVGVTALIARLDPFRVMTIRRMQLSSGYDRTMPWKSAIRWQGDVVAKSKNLWSPEVDSKDITRALLGDYYDELFWKPSLQLLSDLVPIETESRWLTELLAYPIESFCRRKRESFNSLYSELSKSVHFESVTQSAALVDRISIVELVNRCARETAEVALLTNLVSHSIPPFERSKAIQNFSRLEFVEILE